MAALATGRAIGVDVTQVESALEPAPSDAGAVEQVADVSSPHLYLGAAGTNVAERVRIANHRQSTVAIADPCSGWAVRRPDYTISLTRDQVEGAGRKTVLYELSLMA